MWTKVFMLIQQALLSKELSLHTSWCEFVWILLQIKLLTHITARKIVTLRIRTHHVAGSLPSMLQASFNLIILCPQGKLHLLYVWKRWERIPELSLKYGCELMSGGTRVLIQGFHSCVVLAQLIFIPLGIRFVIRVWKGLIRSGIKVSPSFSSHFVCWF